jgi:transposase IS116/IS110/IS902 family protein
MQGRHAARKAAGACRGRIGPAGCGGPERLLAGEDVPGGDQDLACDGGLAEKEIAALVADIAPQLLDEPGIGPLTAAKLVGEIAGAGRFKTDAKLARAAGLAPIPVSSGKTDRHRLDRGGNRQINAPSIACETRLCDLRVSDDDLAVQNLERRRPTDGLDAPRMLGRDSCDGSAVRVGLDVDDLATNDARGGQRVGIDGLLAEDRRLVLKEPVATLLRRSAWPRLSQETARQ